MKLGLPAHRGIFFAALFCIAALLIVAVAAERSDRARHIEYYAEYEEGNALFVSQQFEEAYDIFSGLAREYPNAYVLELKLSVCAMNLGRMEAAAAHSVRVLELYPLLARDLDFMDGFAYTLDEIGAHDAARRVEDYYYNFAALLPAPQPIFETE